MIFIAALGLATGMRTMTPIAVVCWAAYLGYLPVEGTWAFWAAKLVSPILFTLLALGEYAGDTLPRTPSRTDLPLVFGRVCFAIFVGVIVATAMGEPKAGGVVLAVIGVPVGIYGGYRARMAGARWVGRDLPVALAESAVALAITLYAVKALHHSLTRPA